MSKLPVPDISKAATLGVTLSSQERDKYYNSAKFLLDSFSIVKQMVEKKWSTGVDHFEIHEDLTQKSLLNPNHAFKEVATCRRSVLRDSAVEVIGIVLFKYVGEDGEKIQGQDGDPGIILPSRSVRVEGRRAIKALKENAQEWAWECSSLKMVVKLSNVREVRRFEDDT